MDHASLRLEDLRLAQRCVRGDKQANAAIFEAHRLRVHRVVFRVLGANRDLDDVVQDVFIAIFRALPSYRGDAQIGTWIESIAVHVAMHAIRKRKTQARRLELLDGLVVDDPANAPDRRLLMREAARRLYRILDAQTPENRAAFVLHVVDGRSIAEVAELTGASKVATKLRIWRTRARVEAAARQDPVLAHMVDEESAP